jgi:four helix bundle protein
MEKITTHRQLNVYKQAFEAARNIYRLSKTFPKEETYSLTDQIRRSSRSVCSNLAEAFRRRQYTKSFLSKLSESEAEAGETQNWLDFSLNCLYLSSENHHLINNEYENIIGMLINMQKNPDKWSI